MNSNDPVQSKPFVPTLNPRIEMQDDGGNVMIGKRTTTLDFLLHAYPWLAEHIAQLKATQVLAFYENGIPEYRQNLSEPNGDQHELEEIVTAEDCTFLVKTIVGKDDKIRALEEQIKRLRQKNHNQRGELRRLNDAILRKNARVDNVEFQAVKAEALLQEFLAHLQAGNIIIR